MAFLQFPPEVWEIILGELDDSQDVLNAFSAYPELEWEGVLKLKRHLWLFDRVIPHIFPHLSSKNVLICRRVCRQWCHGVNSFLENHPHHTAYSHHNGRNVTGQLWIPPASPQHYNLELGLSGVEFYLKSSAMFSEFLQDMGKHGPCRRNPFMGRSVHIGYWHYDYDSEAVEPGGYPPAVLYWKGVLALLREFGEHIWFLEISFIDIDVPVTFLLCELVIECLNNVTNLKSLKIQVTPEVPLGYRGHLESEEAVEYLQALTSSHIPQLPNLETMEIMNRDFPPSLSKFLTENYSSSIRRFRISAPSWKPEYGTMFQNLTELIVTDISWNSEAAAILHSLSSSSSMLWRLELKCSRPVKPNESVLLMNEVFLLLTGFTKLHSLSLCHPRLVPEDFVNGDLIPGRLPSVKSLVIQDNPPRLHHSILRRFPSLENLKLMSTRLGRIEDPNEILYDARLWGSLLLPKLQTVCLEETGRKLFCTREKSLSLMRDIVEVE